MQLATSYLAVGCDENPRVIFQVLRTLSEIAAGQKDEGVGVAGLEIAVRVGRLPEFNLL